MTPEKPTPIQEKEPRIITVPPAVESLLHPEADSLWPENIRQSSVLREQARERVELSESLTSVFELLPIDTNIQEAFENGTFDENDVVELYDHVSNLLESDSYAGRFILYMPFEILPSREWKTDSETLNNSKNRFIDAYMKAWNDLLFVEDVRANFIGGDFTNEEMNTKEFPRVVKAAHLVSKLIEKKLYSFSEAVALIKKNSGSQLAQSMLEGLLIAEASGLLAPYEEDTLIQLKESNPGPEYINDTHTNSESRQNWLDIETKRKEFEKMSDELMEGILSGTVSREDFRNEYLASEDEIKNAIGISTFRKVMEYFSKENMNGTKDMYAEFETYILRLWASENIKLKDVMIGMWSYFKTIGILDQEYLDTHSINIPSFEGGATSRNPELKQDLDILRSCTEQIALDPELSASLYPASILLGSRTKGYSLSDSDFDMAVFVRPEVDVESRNMIRDKTFQIFKEKNKTVKPVEFWLDENMLIRNLPFDDECIASGFTIDSLFSGIMCGDGETVKMIYEKLLPQYFYPKNKNARDAWLQDLERNNIQYRLMHRGYRHFFPKLGKDIHLSAVESLDNESAFWDAGYRRLASKLFVNKVFLPQLEE